jgi:hypothetical protein
VALITKLQNVAWDMWAHRNGILHADPDRFHRRSELEETNAAIKKEWEQGATGLLKEDRFLFRSKDNVEARSLERKWEWLTAVTLARRAAEQRARPANNYRSERTGMQAWLDGHPARTQKTRQKKKKRPKKKQKTTHHNTNSNQEAQGTDTTTS